MKTPLTPTVIGLPGSSNSACVNSPLTTSKVEYVNGGYGVKNPFLQSNCPVDIDVTPAPSSEPGSYSCRTCGKVIQKNF